MNILTFDTEEWFLEKFYLGDRSDKYPIYDYYFKSILDLLDERKIKATFFCVGGLATHYPEVVRAIADKGHEVGCHSNTHLWLSTFNRNELKEDTMTAIKSLEDVSGQKVVSYRAPAFSIGENNKWALEVLAECGIERDASIYPAVRDFGGFSSFPTDGPCIVKVGDATLKEFPICLTSFVGKQLAYSGGGFFRFFPLSFVKSTMRSNDYNMAYFHIGDVMHKPLVLRSKEFYESYYKEPGTFKNRFVRMMKTSFGTRYAFDKMCKLIKSFDFVNLEEANNNIDWNNTKTISL